MEACAACSHAFATVQMARKRSETTICCQTPRRICVVPLPFVEFPKVWRLCSKAKPVWTVLNLYHWPVSAKPRPAEGAGGASSEYRPATVSGHRQFLLHSHPRRARPLFKGLETVEIFDSVYHALLPYLSFWQEIRSERKSLSNGPTYYVCAASPLRAFFRLSSLAQ